MTLKKILMGHNLQRKSETRECIAVDFRAKDTLRLQSLAVDQSRSGVGSLVDIKLPIRVEQGLTVEVRHSEADFTTMHFDLRSIKHLLPRTCLTYNHQILPKHC